MVEFKKDFIQLKTKNAIYRLLYKNIPYKWHFDEKNRNVTFYPLGNWLFQFNNELPMNIKSSLNLYIEKGRYHRIIRNYGILICKIKEY